MERCKSLWRNKAGGWKALDPYWSEIVGFSCLPWPPPRPSSFMSLLPSDYGDFKNYEELGEEITRYLVKNGYPYNYYLIPDGFAIMSRIERTNKYGDSASENERWIFNNLYGWPGLFNAFGAVFLEKTNQFRFFLFAVTSDPRVSQNYLLSASKFSTIFGAGLSRLPYVIGKLEINKETVVTVYSYEYSSNGDHFNAEQSEIYSSEYHMKKAGLFPSNRRQ